jgi:hypothetical protein
VTLTVQQHQGLHGEGYVFAMACTAGLLTSRPILDVDGIDWLIGSPGPLGTARSPKIEVQVKTTTRPVGGDGSWRFRLAIKHFNALAGPGFDLRRYLIMVTVPDEMSRLAVCDADCMKLQHAAYWVSLADREPLSQGQGMPATTTVRVPQRNLLTPQSLRALVAGDVERGEQS